MNLIIKILLSGLAVFLTAYFLPNISVDGWLTALIVGVVLGLLNAFVKPVIQILTLPITALTLGLFLLVINTLMVMLADYLIGGFQINGFLWAFIFSVINSVVMYILETIFDK